MRPFKVVKQMAFVVSLFVLAACAGTQRDIVVAPPALPAGAPTASQPVVTIDVPQTSIETDSSMVVTATDTAPPEFSGDPEPVTQVQVSGSDRVGTIPPDIHPGEAIVETYRQAERSKPEAQRRRYARHRMCPEDTSRRIAPGERLAITRGHVGTKLGWDCTNANVSRRGSGVGTYYLPPETGVVMRIGRDGRPDPYQPGWQTGCGNTIHEWLDKNPALYEWYDRDQPAVRRETRYAPVRSTRTVQQTVNVTTVPATDVSETGAMLHGTVVAQGYDGPMNCRFELWRDGMDVAYSPWFRLDRVNSAPLPFRYWASNLRAGEEYGYRPYCTAERLSAYGAPMGFATQRIGNCRKHPYLCSVAIAIGTGLFLSAVNDHFRNNDPPKIEPGPNKPPCSGYCTNEPVMRPPTWPGDPGPGGQPNPPPTWPGSGNPGTGTQPQPGPPPPWGGSPGSGNPGTGTQPQPGPPPGWPGNGGTQPPTGNPGGGTQPPTQPPGGGQPPPWGGG